MSLKRKRSLKLFATFFLQINAQCRKIMRNLLLLSTKKVFNYHNAVR